MGKELFHFNTDHEWDYENGFYITSHVSRLAKSMAHYELYKSIVDLPGHVVECGVYKGASLLRFATFREILECQHSRKVIGFDVFGKFPEPEDPTDARFVTQFEKRGGEGMPVDEMKKVLHHKSFTNVELIHGDILETVPDYVRAHPELKIALLHIDVDVYEPTVVILEQLWDHVVRGGLVVFDDYGTVAGETKAVDEFLDGQDYPIEKLPISHIPSFVRK